MYAIRSYYELARINETIVASERAAATDRSEPETKDQDPPSAPGASDAPPSSGDNMVTNKGKLLIDATCAPADIRYPTDISLVNEAREKSEA